MKFVQTSVPEDIHSKLLEIARREGKSLREVVREALEDWITWRYGLINDPFINSKPLDFGVDTDSSKIENYIYGAGS